MSDLTDLLDEAPTPADGLMVEIDILRFGQFAGCGIDAVGKLANLERQLDEIGDREGDISPSDNVLLPSEFAIHAAYPNPFNSTTVISIELPQQTEVNLRIFDITGRELETLVSKQIPAGTYRYTWNAESLPAGLYFCRMESGGFRKTIKLTLVK